MFMPIPDIGMNMADNTLFFKWDRYNCAMWLCFYPPSDGVIQWSLVHWHPYLWLLALRVMIRRAVAAVLTPSTRTSWVVPTRTLLTFAASSLKAEMSSSSRRCFTSPGTSSWSAWEACVFWRRTHTIRSSSRIYVFGYKVASLKLL